MAYDWASHRHIRIPSENIKRSPYKKGYPRYIEEEKNPEMLGKDLTQQLEKAIVHCRRKEKIVLDENILFVLNTEKPIAHEDKLLNRFGLRFSLQLKQKSAIVSADEVALKGFRDDLEFYKKASKLKTHFNEISSISVLEIERVSPELKEWMDSDILDFVEIELLPNLGYENYRFVVSRINDFLVRNGYEHVSHRIDDRNASLKVLVAPQAVKLIVQGVDSVWKVKSAPIAITGKPQSFNIEELPKPKIAEPNIKPICVLDTGIDSSHPLLKDIVMQEVDFTNEGTPKDSNGHGTFVAGLAAYGTLSNLIEPEATAYIISAKIHGKTSNELSYLQDRIEAAVRRFHEQTNIFSLSVMYPYCGNLEHPTELAYTLDKLANEHNVMFVVCSGNIEDDLPSLINSTPYPLYFTRKKCLLYSGAEASSIVTVGGIANEETGRAVAHVGQPSPFTRRGEQTQRSKPDVVFYAGNIERDPKTGKLLGNKNKLGVVSLNNTRKDANLFAYDIGTSYAAPVVANILSRLSREYPDASANLLKALLVHFAFLPESHESLNADENLKEELYGKGMPLFERCARSLNYSPAYIAEDSISYDEVAYIPIYVPRIMKRIYGQKQMRVTIAYNPPVDRGVAGYTLVDLDYRLLKPIKKYEYKTQHNWVHSFRKKWDNVKTDTFRWIKGGWGDEWSLVIIPKVRFRGSIPDTKPHQDFAVVITLEDPNKTKNIYDAIIAETRRITKPLEAYPQSKIFPTL